MIAQPGQRISESGASEALDLSPVRGADAPAQAQQDQRKRREQEKSRPERDHNRGADGQRAVTQEVCLMLRLAAGYSAPRIHGGLDRTEDGIDDLVVVMDDQRRV